MTTPLFWAKEDMDLWNQVHKLTDKEIIDRLTPLIDDAYAEVGMLIQELRKRNGLSSKIINAESKLKLIQYGVPEQEIIEVKI